MQGIKTLKELSKQEAVTAEELSDTLYDLVEKVNPISDDEVEAFIEILARVDVGMHTDYILLRASVNLGIESAVKAGRPEDAYGYLKLIKVVDEKHESDKNK
ncbi:MAG: hypothetical protein WCF94_03940 [bacterium]